MSTHTETHGQNVNILNKDLLLLQIPWGLIVLSCPEHRHLVHHETSRFILSFMDIILKYSLSWVLRFRTPQHVWGLKFSSINGLSSASPNSQYILGFSVSCYVWVEDRLLEAGYLDGPNQVLSENPPGLLCFSSGFLLPWTCLPQNLPPVT